MKNSNRYLVCKTSFFSNVKLSKYLRKHKIEAFGIAKASLGFSAEFFIFWDILSMKSNLSLLQATIVKDKVFWMI